MANSNGTARNKKASRHLLARMVAAASLAKGDLTTRSTPAWAITCMATLRDAMGKPSSSKLASRNNPLESAVKVTGKALAGQRSRGICGRIRRKTS